jgi:hypothetical protein
MEFPKIDVEARKLQQELEWDLHEALKPWFAKYQKKVSWMVLIAALHLVADQEIRGFIRYEALPKNKKKRRKRS